MISSINKLTSKKDPNQSVLSRNVNLLKIYGLLPDHNRSELKYIIFHILMASFVLTQYVELYITRSDVLKLLRNIKYSINSIVITLKVLSFLTWRNKWKSVIDFVIEVNTDRRTSEDKISQDINNGLIKHSRFVTQFLSYSTTCTVLMVLFQPVVEYYFLSDHTDRSSKFIKIVPSWFPFRTDNIVGYLALISYQAYATVYTGVYIVLYDSTAIVTMIFFRGEFELLRRDCQNLFGTINKPIAKVTAKHRLIKCHKRHNDLIKYVKIFDSCLSPIMLLYMIVCSVMLCATAYQLTVETSAMQKIITAEYLIFGVAQLFLYCWHSNEVVYVSTELMLGPYESIWWTRDMSEQRNINILTLQFNKVIVFSAGPFTHITVATFISILKGAYSYYTLLSQSQAN